MRVRTKVYLSSIHVHEDASCAAVEIDQPGGTSVAQISAITPDRHLGEAPGYLIRVWPVNGTHEYGGNNGTFISLVVQFDVEGKPYVTKLSVL